MAAAEEAKEEATEEEKEKKDDVEIEELDSDISNDLGEGGREVEQEVMVNDNEEKDDLSPHQLLSIPPPPPTNADILQTVKELFETSLDSASFAITLAHSYPHLSEVKLTAFTKAFTKHQHLKKEISRVDKLSEYESYQCIISNAQGRGEEAVRGAEDGLVRRSTRICRPTAKMLERGEKEEEEELENEEEEVVVLELKRKSGPSTPSKRPKYPHKSPHKSPKRKTLDFWPKKKRSNPRKAAAQYAGLHHSKGIFCYAVSPSLRAKLTIPPSMRRDAEPAACAPCLSKGEGGFVTLGNSR